MLNLEFPGCRKLVDAIDQAVGAGDETAIADALRATLCRLIRDREVELPQCVYEPVGDHYARRELYTSEKHGYNVVAMAWGPGQGTPIHDHSGMWCVEGVWQGQLEVCQFELVACEEPRYRFRAVGAMQAGPGSAGSLIPPHEYHTIRNPSTDSTAVSLHIYKGRMTCCSVFRQAEDGWYERGTRELCLDRAC